MINSKINDKISKTQEKPTCVDQWNTDLIKIHRHEYETLISQNKFLSELLSGFVNRGVNSSSEKLSTKTIDKKQLKTDYGFYAKIIIAITVIMLALAFHIVYLSVASCLFYTNGNSECWIKSWLGMPVYASFFIDLTLYLLIGFQLILIIMILKSKIEDIKNTKNLC